MREHNYWLERISIAFSCIGSGLAAVSVLFEFRRQADTWPLDFYSIATLLFILTCILGIYMGRLSLLLFNKLGQVGPGRRIVAAIPVFNVLIAMWLFLSIRDPIELPKRLARPIVNVFPPAKTPTGNAAVDLEQKTLGSTETEYSERTTAGEIVNLAGQTGAGVAVRRRASAFWTFMAGASSVLEIFPPPERIDNEQTDAEALADDWQAVADDLWAAIDSYEASLPSVSQTKHIQARSAVMPRAQKSAHVDWPSPELLEAYEKAVPGSARAILDDFLKKSDRRLAMEQQSLSARISIARWGQIFGFVIGIAALIAGAFVAYHEQQIAGSFIGAGGVVGLVSVFVLGRMKLGETTVDK